MDIVKQLEETWTVPVKNGHVLLEYDDSVEQMSNCVFRGELIYLGYERRSTGSVTHMFKDQISGLVFPASSKSVQGLLFAVANERVRVEDSMYKGLFTFVRYSKYTYVRPLTDDELQALALPENPELTM